MEKKNKSLHTIRYDERANWTNTNDQLTDQLSRKNGLTILIVNSLFFINLTTYKAIVRCLTERHTDPKFISSHHLMFDAVFSKNFFLLFYDF